MTSYRAAGVDLDGADRHVESIAEAVTSSWSESVVGGFGGFAAGVTIPAGYSDPVLMMSTDGVGTKLEIARVANRWAGVGDDLVAMSVDDLAAVGAQPIGFVDYMAVGSLQPERDSAIVESIARACQTAGCPLLGGETAEHPEVMAPDAVDLAGTVMGVVEKGSELAPANVRPGHLVVGLASPNLRSNGFSLVRAVLGSRVGQMTESLLAPSVIYSPAVLGAVRTGAVAAAAHITGGGIPGNLIRAIPDGLGTQIDTATWRRPEIFDVIAKAGVTDDDMYTTFNMGIGFTLVVDAAGVDEVLKATEQHSPTVIGAVTNEPGVHLT